MKPKNINIAIAEACGRFEYKPGWKVVSARVTGPFRGGFDVDILLKAPDGTTYPLEVTMPNYCADLNAMAEAETELAKKSLYCEYADELDAIVNPRPHMSDSYANWCCIHATARQRAEAFLRVLGKWVSLFLLLAAVSGCVSQRLPNATATPMGHHFWRIDG